MSSKKEQTFQVRYHDGKEVVYVDINAASVEQVGSFVIFFGQGGTPNLGVHTDRLISYLQRELR